MLKYIELTAPEGSEYRQTKILSIEVKEGDVVKAGDPLFTVLSGKKEIDLPSTMDGRIFEVLVTIDQTTTSMTSLVILETQVPDKNIPKPAAPVRIEQSSDKVSKSEVAQEKMTSKQTKSDKKNQTQQQLNLGSHDGVSSNNNTLMAIHVPDIGADSAKVIELLVKEGDQVNVGTSLLSLESDKASMDIPSACNGVIHDIAVKVDQQVSEGSLLLHILSPNNKTVEQADKVEPQEKTVTEHPKTPVATTQQTLDLPQDENKQDEEKQNEEKQNEEIAVTKLLEITIPDIGGPAKVIEVLVKAGQRVKSEESLLTLESDKASMDLPSPADGIIDSICVQLDDTVDEGDLVMQLKISDVGSETAEKAIASSDEPAASETPSQSTPVAAPSQPVASQAKASAQASVAPTASKSVSTSTSHTENKTSHAPSHATPSIRFFARELGVDLSKVNGTGRKKRITRDDVNAYVKGVMNGQTASPSASSAAAPQGGTGIPSIPDIDFTKFGEVENFELNRIKRLTATNLHRSWVNVPHVTHHDETNARQIEVLRKGLKDEYAQQGIKISPLVFIIKACVSALKAYPTFNSSLHSSGEHLILKKYYNIGIAVDTPNGLVVPVIRDADKKGVKELAQELADISERARTKKLKPTDLQGATFSISSLGGIGGRYFTPIVNAPEVAILGVSRTKISPEWNGSEFIPTPMLPLSLSYDHRVVDGAEAARFSAHVCNEIANFSLN